jgi:restriction endonuclease S subunit
MTELLECLNSLEASLTSAEATEASLLAERKAYLLQLKNRLDQLRSAQIEAEKELARAKEDKIFVDTEYLPVSEKRKLLRIWSRLTLGECQKVAGEWRAFVGKFPCSDDNSQDNWNLLKQALKQLQSQ